MASVERVAENHAFDHLHLQCFCFDLVNALFFQRGKKGLHSGVVVASSGMAHTLYRAVPGQGFPVHLAGKLASSITVKRYAKGLILFCSQRE